MKNYAKQQPDDFCSGQTLILGSESHELLHNESDHSDVIEALNLVPKIREFKSLKTSIHKLENGI